MTDRPDRNPRPGEFELIARLFAPLAQTAPGAFGLRDDAAVLAVPPGHELVLKTDAIVEGVDFFRSDPPAAIAQKALRVNVSDLAAKGAVPVGYLLTLLLPDWPDLAWLDAFARGLADDQNRFGISLMGGDTSGTPGPLAISIAAFGFVPNGAMIRREGAQAGDLVFVSGTVGDAGAGLAVLKGEGAALAAAAREALVGRYHLPSPKPALGVALRGIATAALDVSDGLIADLGHMADVSHVQIVVEGTKLPLSAETKALWGSDRRAWVRAATVGDDYEIAFTAPAEKRSAVFDVALRTKIGVTEIGHVAAGTGVVLLDADGSEIALRRKGFVHF